MVDSSSGPVQITDIASVGARDSTTSGDINVGYQVVHPCPCCGGVTRGKHRRIGRGSAIVVHCLGVRPVYRSSIAVGVGGTGVRVASTLVVCLVLLSGLEETGFLVPRVLQPDIGGYLGLGKILLEFSRYFLVLRGCVSVSGSTLLLSFARS